MDTLILVWNLVKNVNKIYTLILKGETLMNENKSFIKILGIPCTIINASLGKERVEIVHFFHGGRQFNVVGREIAEGLISKLTHHSDLKERSFV